MKKEISLMEGDIPARKNFLRDKIIHLVGFLTIGIAKKDTRVTTRSKLIASVGRDKTKGTKNPEMSV